MSLQDIDSKMVLMKLMSDSEQKDNSYPTNMNSNAQAKKFTTEQAITYGTWKEQANLLVISLSIGP